MRKVLPVVLLLTVSLVGSVAQDAQVLLNTFRRNFERAEQLDVKLKVLKDSIKAGSYGMGPLYQDAVEYVVDRSESLLADTLVKQIALLAVEQIQSVGYTKANSSLWRLFKLVEETNLRVAILSTLGVVGQGDETVVRGVVEWLGSENSLYLTLKRPDLQVIKQAVQTLGELKSSRAFAVLFTAKELQYSDAISTLAEKALMSLEGDLKENLIKIIQEGPLSEKLSALKMAMATKSLQSAERAEIAEIGLEIGMYTTTSDRDEQRIAREIRRVALKVLSDANWSKASSLAIEHFGMTLVEFDRGFVTKAYLLEAIYGLGKMGTHESAERLTLYLELLNSYTEHGRAYDEQIVLAVLENLRILGDKVAFANLSYTQYLNYSDKVKEAAQKAIDTLKW
jgi:hypothetical protein